MTAAKQLRRDLGLDVKPVRLEREVVRDVSPHDLVAGLHVREPPAEEPVGHSGQQPIRGDPQPWARRTSRQEPGSVYDLRFAGQNRLNELRQLHRIQLEIGVLNRDNRARGVMQAVPHRASLAAIDACMQDSQDARARGDPIEQRPRSVRRSVIDDNNLSGNGKPDLKQTFDDLLNG